MIRLIPKTGRKHQLRVQLSNLGHPILGDEKYGGERILKDKIFLHCYKMSIPHPVKREEMEFNLYHSIVFLSPSSKGNLGFQRR